ncbi:uncharacterized protein BYT42DRAFT_582251 [Radiomyces spectabilis]|uniref:uncharacterized protein n=1 Tax=Radiomyces spectabilis TaxID=64574 RepID=UPI00221FD240|nr:uncharacterized protein BYT42DRAFT_582251 [Radiomyces spectabilis]KAI8370399.1 hypothetical protein BYT42DRAFT_582251 [Radiomyces spectabilis]
MASKMLTDFDDISDDKRGVLQRQFEASPFAQHEQDRRPITLEIFDFDSTLFLSPLLSPQMWHSSLIKLITTENLLGPGWWRDTRSLELGPLDELKKSAWANFWNESVVESARKAIQDPNKLVVVLTGRRYHPFHHLIDAMLKAKGLQFDIIGLRPDPESDDADELGFNTQPNVFDTTMEFKSLFLINMLANVPSLENVIMWDDRVSHVRWFRNYMKTMVAEGLIKHGQMIDVHAVRPRYNPKWEYAVVNNILETHNKAIQSLKHDDERRRALASTAVVADCNGTTVSALHQFRLTRIPSATIIKLSPEHVQLVKSAFQRQYTYEISKRERQLKPWERHGAEALEFFGNEVIVSPSTLPADKIPYGGLGAPVKIHVIATTRASYKQGMVLLVSVESAHDQGDCGKHILPLWYKPSFYTQLYRQSYVWHKISRNQQKTLDGTVDYARPWGVQVADDDNNS